MRTSRPYIDAKAPFVKCVVEQPSAGRDDHVSPPGETDR